MIRVIILGSSTYVCYEYSCASCQRHVQKCVGIRQVKVPRDACRHENVIGMNSASRCCDCPTEKIRLDVGKFGGRHVKSLGKMPTMRTRIALGALAQNENLAMHIYIRFRLVCELTPQAHGKIQQGMPIRPKANMPMTFRPHCGHDL